MSTHVTPRITRTLAYASQEMYAYDPKGVAPLHLTYNLMLANDEPEAEVVRFLLQTVFAVLVLEELEGHAKELEALARSMRH